MTKNNYLLNKDVKTLLSGLCCSICQKDFDKNSLTIIEQYKEVLVCNLKCCNCGKDFGEVVLGMNMNEVEHTPVYAVEGGNPISFDDVIDAHKFIKENL